MLHQVSIFWFFLGHYYQNRTNFSSILMLLYIHSLHLSWKLETDYWLWIFKGHSHNLELNNLYALLCVFYYTLTFSGDYIVPNVPLPFSWRWPKFCDDPGKSGRLATLIGTWYLWYLVRAVVCCDLIKCIIFLTARVHFAGCSTEMKRLQLYRHEMQHFAKVIEEYIVSQVIHVSWHEFQLDLGSKISNIDDLIQCHVTYLNKCLAR